VGGVPRLEVPEWQTARHAGVLIEGWFVRHGRDFPWRSWTDTYRLAIAEVMLQRTRAPSVAAFLPSFFDRYPDWQSLINSDESSIADILRPMGLHARRAQALRALAVSVVTEPDLDWELRPGVGQYISRALRVRLDGTSEAMVDSNFVRLVHRVFGGVWRADYRYDSRLQALALDLVGAATSSEAVNWGVLDLGASICTPRAPRCPVCPLRTICAAATSPDGPLLHAPAAAN